MCVRAIVCALTSSRRVPPLLFPPQFDKEFDLASKKELLLSSSELVIPRSEFNIRIRPGVCLPALYTAAL